MRMILCGAMVVGLLSAAPAKGDDAANCRSPDPDAGERVLACKGWLGPEQAVWARTVALAFRALARAQAGDLKGAMKDYEDSNTAAARVIPGKDRQGRDSAQRHRSEPDSA